MKKIITFLVKDKKFLAAFFLLVLFCSVFAQLVPYIQGMIVDAALLTLNQKTLIALCILVGVVLLLDCFCKFYLSFILANFGARTSKKINSIIFAEMLKKPYNFFEEKSKGDLLYRSNTYTADIGVFISRDILNFVVAVARVIIISVFLFSLSLFFGAILVALYALVLLFTWLIAPKIMRGAENTKRNELKRNAVILENIDGLEQFLAYSNSGRNMGFYATADSRYSKIRQNFYTKYNILFPLVDFLVCLGTLAIYIIAFNQSINILEIGSIVAVLSYTVSILTPMQNIAQGIASGLEVSATIEKVFEIEQGEQTKSTESVIAQKTSFDKVDLILKNVCHKKEKYNINFKNLSLTIRHGEKVLLYGDYGSGKTTFSELITGLVNADSGQIFFNDSEINSLDKSDLAQIISLSSDSVGIIRGTIFQNVKFANPTATDEEVQEAIKKSGLLRVLKSFKNEKVIVDSQTLSESDKQLISLARLILRNPKIVVVDETLRDLMHRKKQTYINALKRFTKDKTLIFISEEDNDYFTYTQKLTNL